MSEITDDEKLARRRALAKARLDETLGRSGFDGPIMAHLAMNNDALRVRVTDLDVALQKSQEEVADLKNIELYAQSAIRETEAERDAAYALLEEAAPVIALFSPNAAVLARIDAALAHDGGRGK